MDDQHIEEFEWPEYESIQDGPAPPDLVAVWLHTNGVKQIDSYKDLGDWFNEYGLQYGYHHASHRKIAMAVRKSHYWRTCRGPKPKRKHYYKVKIPRRVLIREVA